MSHFRAFIASSFGVLTFIDYTSPRQTAVKLLSSPAVHPYRLEFERRDRVVKKVQSLRSGTRFDDPFAASLTVPLRDEVEARVDNELAEQQRTDDLAAQQRKNELEALQDREKDRQAETRGARSPNHHQAAPTSVHPYNQQVIRAIIDACRDYETFHASQWEAGNMEHWKEDVLGKWRISKLKGTGVIGTDAAEAMKYITRKG